MSQFLAFFPWIHVAEAHRIGRFELCPYLADDSRLLPKHHELVAAYRDGSGHSVRGATLVAVDGEVGGSLSDSDIADLFRLRDAVSFVGLTERRFFDSVSPYVNDHSFRLVVQGYEADRGGAFLSARRRDGQQRIFVDQSVHLERHPHHVSANVEPELDYELLETILACLLDDSGELEWLVDTIELFSLANTDSPDIRPHTELVLISSAIQRALGASKKSRVRQLDAAFAEALDRVVPAHRSPSDSKKPLSQRELAAEGGLRSVWFADLYKARGTLAHGRTSPSAPTHWSVDEHLLLSSHIVPLLVLARLDELGVHPLSDDEREGIGSFDWLLCLENVLGTEPSDFPGHQTHSWKTALSRLAREWATRRAVSVLERSGSSS